MYGVIIWSDQVQGRAVIWCEDHGDLVFYGGDASRTAVPLRLEPGDLVWFELDNDENLRLAINPRLVATDEYPSLLQDLKATGHEFASTTQAKPILRSVGGNHNQS